MGDREHSQEDIENHAEALRTLLVDTRVVNLVSEDAGLRRRVVRRFLEQEDRSVVVDALYGRQRLRIRAVAFRAFRRAAFENFAYWARTLNRKVGR